jgi:hypothetical protein
MWVPEYSYRINKLPARVAACEMLVIGVDGVGVQVQPDRGQQPPVLNRPHHDSFPLVSWVIFEITAASAAAPAYAVPGLPPLATSLR